jgi:hypothetical protein
VRKLGSWLGEPAFWGLFVVFHLVGLLVYALAFVMDLLVVLLPGSLGEHFSAREWVEDHLDPFGNSAP